MPWSLGDPIYNRSDSPCDFPDVPDRETTRLQKFGKLMAGPNTDLGMVDLFTCVCACACVCACSAQKNPVH